MSLESPKVEEEQLLSAAFERVKNDFAKVQPSEFAQPNLDIPAAVRTIVGSLPEARQLRAAFQKDLPAFDLAAFDKLEDYAFALSFANTRYQIAVAPPDDLEEVSAEASELREKLLGDARALVNHKLVNPKQLEKLAGGNGIKNVTEDLQMLTHVLQDSWPKIQGRIPTTAEDLDRAQRLSARLIRIIGNKEQSPEVLAEATDRRLRALTMALNVYEETRRAVMYLRFKEGDADTITPSLYGGRPRRKPGAGDKPDLEPVPGTGTPPAARPAASGEAPKAATAASSDPFMPENASN